MYIHEAVKQAMEEGRYVAVDKFKHIYKMSVTDTSWGLVYISIDKPNEIMPRWQPSASELIRDDYVVVD